jgi:hypothetical protein
VVAHRDRSGTSRLRVAPWLPSADSTDPHGPIEGAGGSGPRRSALVPGQPDVVGRPRVDVTADPSAEPPDHPAEPAGLLRPIRLDGIGRRRGRWWFVLVPAAVVVLVVAVALQFKGRQTPERPPLPQMSPQVVLPELTPPASAGAASDGANGSAAPSGTRRTTTGPAGAGTATGAGPPGGGGAGPTPPAATAAAVQPGSIVGPDGRCLESTGSGGFSAVQLAGCANVSRQRWSAQGDGTVRNSGSCLDVLFNGRGNGTPVVLNRCDGTDSQEWRISGSGWRNPRSNRCLTASGGRLTINDCTGASNQRFSLT